MVEKTMHIPEKNRNSGFFKEKWLKVVLLLYRAGEAPSIRVASAFFFSFKF